MSTRRVHVLVSGRVQGVFFRSSLQEHAERRGLTGWVRNLDDGRVEAELQGPAEQVEQALAFVAAGPESAQVDRLLTSERDPIGDDTGFQVQ